MGDFESAPLREDHEEDWASNSVQNGISKKQDLVSCGACFDDSEALLGGRYSLDDGLTSISALNGNSTPEVSPKLKETGVLDKENAAALSSDSSILSRMEGPSGICVGSIPFALSRSSISI